MCANVVLRGLAAGAILAAGVMGCSSGGGDGAGRDGGPGPDASPDGTEGDGGSMTEMPDPDADGGTGDDGGPRMRVEPQPPGSSCNCDDECQGTDTHPGVCVFGVCMQRADGTCSAAGSRDECPDGSRCWGLEGADGSLCWPDCDAFDCDGSCDSDGSCVPTSETGCMASCGDLCGPGECAPDNPMGVCSSDDQACIEGECVTVCSPDAPDGFCPSGSSCEDGTCISDSGCPTWMCSGTSCADLVTMPGSYDPDSSEAEVDGYYIATHPDYAYLRRDLTLLVQYAACEVVARYPGTAPIGLSDMTQADGMTPGTDVGSPRHPTTTHTGNDIDIAYYQTDGTNNPQIICGDGSDTNANGTEGTYNDGYFCTTDENIVDWPRQAYWFAKLSSTPLVRVFGVDETLPDDFREHLDALLSDGAITAGEHERALSLGYGSDGGWSFHHHHTHNSYYEP